MPGGRPSLYRPEYCAKIVEVCGEGASITEFAHEIGVTPKSVYTWKDTHEEFSHAFTRAKVACKTWWERHVRSNINNREANAKLIEFMMSNLFPEDYGNRQRIEIAHTGQVNVRSLPDSELERLAAQAVIDIEEVEPKKLAQEGQTSGQNNDTETPSVDSQ